MFIPFFSSLTAAIIACLVLFLAYTLSSRSFKDREKRTPFECGFDPKDKARLPFSTRFFLLAVIFLVFDIEIVLLIPAPVVILSGASNLFLFALFTFLFVLILGTLHE